MAIYGGRMTRPRQVGTNLCAYGRRVKVFGRDYQQPDQLISCVIGSWILNTHTRVINGEALGGDQCGLTHVCL